MSRCYGYHRDLVFWYSPQPGVELQMLLGSEQLVDGVKLGAVAQVLVHLPHLCSDAATEPHAFFQSQCLD